MFNPVAPYLFLICFLSCICLWQISHIQTCLHVVVGPGLVSTSLAFMRSIVSHPAGPHGRLAQKTVIGPHCWGREGSTQFEHGLPDHCNSSTACRLCRSLFYRIISCYITYKPANFYCMTDLHIISFFLWSIEHIMDYK